MYSIRRKRQTNRLTETEKQIEMERKSVIHKASKGLSAVFS